MNIRRAEKSDVEILLEYDKHISKEEMESIISLGSIILQESINNSNKYTNTINIYGTSWNLIIK